MHEPAQRRHDIDALRAIAFGLVIAYHLGMYYVAGWGWHLKSVHAADWLQWPMRFLNLWRMDLVFLVSGLALSFLAARSPAALLRERSLRLLLPLAFGMVVVVPYQPYAQGVANGLVAPGFGDFLLRYYGGGPWPRGAFDGWDAGITWNHLWFLAYLWLYTVLLLALLPLLRSRLGQAARQGFTSLRGARLVVLPLLPLWGWSVLLWPRFPAYHNLVGDHWTHAVSATLFLYGWWIANDGGWWQAVTQRRWTWLALAAATFALHLGLRQAIPADAPWLQRLPARLAGDAYAWLAILSALAWAHRLLNRPWRWLPWAQESVYPWYVLHQTLILLLAAQLAPLALGPVAEALLIGAGTVAGCLGLTALVRRSRRLRPLFGLQAADGPADAWARTGGKLPEPKRPQAGQACTPSGQALAGRTRVTQPAAPVPPRCPSPGLPAHPGVHSGG